MNKILLFVFGFLASVSVMAQTCVNAPIVTEVYPRASELPENLLRFYIYFDQPMKTKVEPNAVRLIDENGTIVKDTFLTHKVDLWSQDKQRLTVLFDPGRVKTGLQAHHQLGRALKNGHRYRLEIDTSFIGVSGCHLAAVYSKDFDVAGPDKQIPDPDHWTITTPKAGTTDKINIALNGVYDHVSLAYRIRIKDKKGQVVPGYIEISDDDSDWMFKPDQPWRFETYLIVIDPLLEDSAGNRINGLFEQPLNNTPGSEVSIEFIVM